MLDSVAGRFQNGGGEFHEQGIVIHDENHPLWGLVQSGGFAFFHKAILGLLAVSPLGVCLASSIRYFLFAPDAMLRHNEAWVNFIVPLACLSL
jgi:hypothetical protein